MDLGLEKGTIKSDYIHSIFCMNLLLLFIDVEFELYLKSYFPHGEKRSKTRIYYLHILLVNSPGLLLSTKYICAK